MVVAVDQDKSMKQRAARDEGIDHGQAFAALPAKPDARFRQLQPEAAAARGAEHVRVERRRRAQDQQQVSPARGTQPERLAAQDRAADEACT